MPANVNIPLSPKDKLRIERLRNRKGRRKPAKVPARLTRTSAFAPKRRGLITDSGFKRLYIVPNHSVVQVSGRELGSQHRDALYALFRLPYSQRVILDEDSPIKRTTLFVVETTWRELITALDLTIHANNVASTYLTFEEIMHVQLTVFEGDRKQQQLILEEVQKGNLPDVPFRGGHIIHDFEATGTKLDDIVTITYGKWVTESMVHLRLVSLNADVQFRLKSDYAKSFWPYIDSMNNHTFVDEDSLAILAGRNLWAENETSATRRDFRASCKKAFDDMVNAGGLKSWSVTITGSGRKKSRRYTYEPALAVQMELELGT